jgi:hypothetical protein
VDSALNLTVERTRPIPLPLTSGKAWKETANRRADDRGRAIDLREDDFSGRPPGEQATLNRIAAADKNVRCLKRRPAEPKQRRAVSEKAQLERAAAFSWPDETPSDSLDLAPVGKTQALRPGGRELNDGLPQHDPLFGLNRTVTRLTLPRPPAIHIEDSSQWRTH